MPDPIFQPTETPARVYEPEKVYETEKGDRNLLPGDRNLLPGDRNLLPWIAAAVTVLAVVVLAFLVGGHAAQPGTASPNSASYAGSLVLSHIQMSQASNFAGSQLTYVDGVISNHGSRTVTHVTVQALFANDAGEPPQAEQVPFTLIRSRDPYIDTVPVSASPLAPGTSRDFRLIYDDVSPMWNQQLPVLKVLSVTTRP